MMVSVLGYDGISAGALVPMVLVPGYSESIKSEDRVFVWVDLLLPLSLSLAIPSYPGTDTLVPLIMIPLLQGEVDDLTIRLGEGGASSVELEKAKKRYQAENEELHAEVEALEIGITEAEQKVEMVRLLLGGRSQVVYLQGGGGITTNMPLTSLC